METNAPDAVAVSERACHSCRQRRVKCDKRIPGCLRCEKLGRPCTGYDTERKFLDEGAKVRRKYDGNLQTLPDLSRRHVTSPPTNPVAPTTRQEPSRNSPSQYQRLPIQSHTKAIPDIISQPTSSPLTLPGIASLSPRQSTPNVQYPLFGVNPPTSPGYNIFQGQAPQPFFSSSIPHPPANAPSHFPPAPQHPPQRPDQFQYGLEQGTAKLLRGKPQYAPSETDTYVSEDYFDLDIDTYYANGNNACGFIPGLPVILTDTNEPETDEDLLTNDYASLSGRSSVYDSSEGGRKRPEYSQKYLHERTTELAALTRHFVQVVSPSMDLFDLDTYFSRIVPLKAVQNVMLRSAMAAVAANQIGQLLAKGVTKTDLQHLVPLLGENGGLQETDWFYKAANYYDRGISYLRIFLQRWLSDTSNEMTGHTSKYPSRRFSDGSSKESSTLSAPNKRRRISEQSSAGADMEALVAAISVFSLYESLDNPTKDWSQHLDGFKALLDTKILPQAVTTPGPKASPFISMKASRAAFWNFARADYLAAYINRSKTRLDPDNLLVWKALGLPITDEGGLVYNDPSTPTNAMVSYQTRDREDMVSCALIWIVLRVMNFLAPHDDHNPETAAGTPNNVFDSPGTLAFRSPSETGASTPIQGRIARWKQLRRQLEDWYDNLPFTFQPYAMMGAASQHPYDQPPETRPRFTRIFFSVPMCAAALQLYHFAQILLLLNQPVDESAAGFMANRIRMFRKVSEESEHHSRQICGIALGKPPPAVSRQMVHSLHLAGLCFEEREDRLVVLELLGNIEKETGASTSQRARELREAWGWGPEVREVA
ncbi:hypothetical protein PV08_11270 [Exophiala spinifera]|uniref:Zn(2)-C6 fungal-type domain-containing protein n=1 Tax=Exophiala spinifera TaxID=91928 RepID=A0A0D2AU81_9EURO|nr:uncharacterized protein PV08_11270 [Exophiala spinifera]KIW10308.1 hypothetical protein PV08_11270 [Exophiala spinifera]